MLFGSNLLEDLLNTEADLRPAVWIWQFIILFYCTNSRKYEVIFASKGPCKNTVYSTLLDPVSWRNFIGRLMSCDLYALPYPNLQLANQKPILLS